VRFILEEQLLLSGDNKINWKNILLVERLKTYSEGIAFIVTFLIKVRNLSLELA
jgi:hypothetical protein